MDTLLTLFRKLKRNAQCVSCTLGGGWLGYLGLILTQDTYNKILNSEEFTRPQNPDLFKLKIDSTNQAPKCTRAQTTTTQGESDEPNITFTASNIAQQKAARKEALRLYLECQVVEQAVPV